MTTSYVVCPSCGSLVGVRDDKCYSCGRSNPGLWGYGPLVRKIATDFGFVPVVVGGSTIIYALSLLVSGSRLQIAGGGFSFLSPSFQALMLFGMSGTYPVFELGWWWTLLTASWLHGNLLHILFNMMWVRDLGTAMVDFVGTARTIIIYTVSGVCGFLLSSVAGRAGRSADPVSARRREYGGRVRRDFRIAGRDGALREERRRQLARPCDGDAVRRHPVHLRADHAGRR